MVLKNEIFCAFPNFHHSHKIYIANRIKMQIHYKHLEEKVKISLYTENKFCICTDKFFNIILTENNVTISVISDSIIIALILALTIYKRNIIKITNFF
jgi:hypothetical protein